MVGLDKAVKLVGREIRELIWAIAGAMAFTSCTSTRAFAHDQKEERYLWSNYGPLTIPEDSKTGFGSHPRRGFSINYD
jgi:hypothetical protein